MARFTFFYLLSLICITLCNSSCTQSEKQDKPKGGTSPVEQLFKKGEAFQAKRQYERAINEYKACIATDTTDASVAQSYSRIIASAMQQLMNCYQFNGDPEQCAQYFISLHDSASSIIRHYCQRDLLSISAYAFSRTERMKEAETLIIEALKLPNENYTPQLLYRDYAYAAAIFFSDPSRQDDVISWCKAALSQAQIDSSIQNTEWLKSLLATLYKRIGKVNEALELLEESLDEARKKRDLLSEANALVALSELYLYWELPEYANNSINSAIETNRRSATTNPMVSGQIYLLKSQSMYNLEKEDSAIYFLDKAKECCARLPYNSGMADIDYFYGSILARKHDSQSIQKGIEYLGRAAQQATTGIRAKAYYFLAQGYNNLHNDIQTNAMLDSMYNLLHQSNNVSYIRGANNFALKYYLSKNNSPQINRYAIALNDELEKTKTQQKQRRLIKSIVMLKTENEQKQLQIAHNELTKMRNTYIVCIVVFILVLIILAIVFFYKRRLYHVEKWLLEKRLDELSEKIELINQQKTQTEEQLAGLLANDTIRKSVEIDSPELSEKNGEEKFRFQFSQLYPNFLPNLKLRIPNIGRREELFCMLIALGQNSYQIEATLNIAHSSVNMARYRLRQKLGLNKDESLEDTIKGMTA